MKMDDYAAEVAYPAIFVLDERCYGHCRSQYAGCMEFGPDRQFAAAEPNLKPVLPSIARWHQPKWGLPLARLEQASARFGVTLSDSVKLDSVEAVQTVEETTVTSTFRCEHSILPE